MDNTAARQRILNRIERALQSPVDKPYADLSPIDRSHAINNPAALMELFRREFVALLGNFFMFDSVADMNASLRQLAVTKPWKKICCEENLFGFFDDPMILPPDRDNVLNADVAITGCEALIAKTGTVVLSSSSTAGRALPVYAPAHITVAYQHQLFFDLEACLQLVMDEGSDALPSSMVFASGPSRTGDIEKTLVVGVHGPRETYVFMLP